MEVHPNPDEALSDGTNMWPLDGLEDLLRGLKTLDLAVKEN
jgi:2-dehydro-3-deoxyphosphooctonate aldolase (KDO 8-P synthase)